MALPPGFRVGPYEIQSPLGAGGMGEVYRARDPRLGRDVAIKVLPAAWSADRERLQRFEQEARAAAALNHPNILAVYDIGEHPSTDSGQASPYIVSELLEGDTLRERLNGGALAVRKAVEYAVEITRGLAAAHEKGIVHRDLKPENIFVTGDGHLKVLDFGLAKLTQPDVASVSISALPTTPPDTQPGVMLGTVGYMSPEQVRGAAVDHRADIFAFGLVLYEMLSGRRAFQRETGIETMTAILKEDPPDLPMTERHIPPALGRIVDRCLEKSPAARFQSAADLGFALEALSTHSDSGIAAAAKSIAHRSALHRLLPWATTLVFLATTLALGARQFFLAPPSNAPVIQFQVPPPAGGIFPGANNAPRIAISPDGQHLAFTANLREGKQDQLWIRRLDSSEARVFANTESPEGATEPVQGPFWSPDSRYLAFFADGRLKKLDIETGNVQSVLAVPGTNWSGAWNHDGTILFGTSSTKGIQRVSADGGASTQLTATDAARNERQHLYPQFLPNRRQFLYFVVGDSLEDRATYVGSLDSPESKLVLRSEYMTHFAPPDQLLFVRDGALMAQRFDVGALELQGEAVQIADGVQGNPGNGRLAVTTSDTGVLVYRPGAAAEPDLQLVWLDRTGKQLGAVGAPSPYRGVELSPDESRVAVHRESRAGSGDLWVLDLQRGSTSRLTLDSTQHSMSPVWSSDGRRIFFSRQNGPSWGLYERDSSGVGREELIHEATTALTPLSVSSDRRSLIYRTGPPGDYFILTLDGARNTSPYIQTQFNEVFGQLSPDARWMAYASDELGRNDIYVQSFPQPTTKYAVSTTGGSSPRWRGDGRELFYLSPVAGYSPTGAMMSVAVEAAGDGLRLGIPQVLFDPVVGSSVHVAAPAVIQYSVTRDGKRFLVARQGGDGDSEPGSEPLAAIVNWTSLLNRR